MSITLWLCLRVKELVHVYECVEVRDKVLSTDSA